MSERESRKSFDASAFVSTRPPPSEMMEAARITGAPEVAATSLTTEALIGKVLDGRYLVEGVLGEGGMGIVFRGRHKMIDKRVAIKVLRGEMARDREIMERFLQEARAASAIGNPHIVDISDFGALPDGSTYFVMEHLDGQSLTAIMSKGRVEVRRIAAIARQIAEGLGAAHAANIIHRDLKPDNVMVVSRGSDKDFVKILDFGIAKVGGAASTKTRAGSVFGTPHYMSPEQAAGTTVDHRTDIYALGVIMYEMAAGKVPFDADNFMGILTQHMYKAPIPMRALVPDVEIPPGLDAIVLKCLTKKPEGRYANMEEVVADLDALVSGRVPGAVGEMMARSGSFNVPADYFRGSHMPVPVPGQPGESSHRSRWPLILVIAATFGLVGVGIIAIVLGPKGPATSASAQTTVSTGPAIPTAPATVPPSATVTTPTAVATASAKKMLVTVLNVETQGASVMHGPTKLPVVKGVVRLDLPEGEAIDLVVSANGYESKTVTLRAGDTEKVDLARKRPAGQVAPPDPRPKPDPAPIPRPRPACDPDDPFCK